MENQIIQNFALKELNTFKIISSAKNYIKVNNADFLHSFIIKNLKNFENVLILGGGSNVLFTSNYDGLVIHPVFKGIEIIDEDSSSIYLKVMCGENWDDFVFYCVKNNWGGLENLSLIPGNVGAAPIQNIGAYGVEAKDTIYKVTAIDLNTGKKIVFNNQECKFDYRNSIFKNELAGKLLIYHVVFKLTKKHHLNICYGSIEEELEKYDEKNIVNLRNIIINIRRNKLPDTNKIGNAGSFFKNPTLNSGQFNKLIEMYPECPHFSLNNEKKKIPAAWLIEKCGWKGKKTGNAGVYLKQPLVLINYGNATGKEILELAKQIQNSVYEKFNIELKREVKVI